MVNKCTGDKPECQGDDYVGEGIFVCRYYDSQNETCKYKE